ncbi:MAG: hypothetical protein JO300_12985 [Silvibacterium sp.]|nr:hypothetical protein [Silvibacterium sp.]
MSPLSISLIVFVCVFGSALLGLFLSRELPLPHQTSESRDIVRLGMGLVATTVAVALGLLVSSAKSFYDTQCAEVTQLAANYVLLDRMLSHYGPEANDTRAALRAVLAFHLNYPAATKASSQIYGDIRSGTKKGEVILDRIEALTPRDDNQRFLKGQALSLAFQLGQTRWLMFEQNTVPVPRLLLGMLIGWLIVLFLSFGIFAPRNFTVIVGLFLAALAVCGAILLILGMYHPETGLIQVSDAPLRAALAQLGQ